MKATVTKTESFDVDLTGVENELKSIKNTIDQSDKRFGDFEKILNAQAQEISDLKNKPSQVVNNNTTNIVQNSLFVNIVDFFEEGDVNWVAAWYRAHDFLREKYLVPNYDGAMIGEGPSFVGFQNTAWALCPTLYFPSGVYNFDETMFFHPKVSYLGEGNHFESTTLMFEKSNKYVKDTHKWSGLQTNLPIAAMIVDGLKDKENRMWDGRGISIKNIKILTKNDAYTPLSIVGYQTNLYLENVHIANRDSTGFDTLTGKYREAGHGISLFVVSKESPINCPWGAIYGKNENAWQMDSVFNNVFVEGCDIGFLVCGAGIRLTNCGAYFTKQGFYLLNTRYSSVVGFLYNTEDMQPRSSWDAKTLMGIARGRSNTILSYQCHKDQKPWIWDTEFPENNTTIEQKTPNNRGFYGKAGVTY